MPETQLMEQNHNLRQSVGAGVKSVFASKGRTYFVLQHKTHSAFHRNGEEQEIIIDYVELGRDPKCQVRFDESQRTVSRRHAAITREGNNWVLRNMSRNNPTLINGRPVNVQWFLNNGDEIQLSMEGPRMGFILPANNSVSSIPLSRRLSLFRQQALLPYKRALVVITALFFFAIGALSFWLYRMNQTNLELAQNLEATIKEGKMIRQNVDSMQTRLATSEKSADALKKQLLSLKKMVKRQRPSSSSSTYQGTGTPPPSATEDLAQLERMYPGVFYIRLNKIEATLDDVTQEISTEDYDWTGTGFLLRNGQFITARHIVEPWFFLNNKEPELIDWVLNMVVTKGGRVNATFDAYASDGTKLTLQSRDFTVDRSEDEMMSIVQPATGEQIMVSVASLQGGKDWASTRTGKSGVIESASGLSQNLPTGAKLHILGFPLGFGANSATNIKPIYGSSTVSSTGLTNGIILIGDRNFESGNSGGPAFFYYEGKYVAVGIVSAAVGRQTGYIIPIANVR